MQSTGPASTGHIHKTDMCDWRSKYQRQQSEISARAKYDDTGGVVISGQVKNADPDAFVVFWAASPPDYRTSFSGSGLPYANSEMAYDNTPNRGTVPIQADGTFQFKMRYPSGYYTGLGTIFMQPHVSVQVNSPTKVGTPMVVRIDEGVPFRMLTYPPMPETAPRCSPNFYGGRDNLPVRTQEQILRDSGYPSTNQMPANFWGLKPPQ